MSDARCTIMARPTSFFVSGVARQWEYQNPETSAPVQSNSPAVDPEYAPITGAFGFRLGAIASFDARSQQTGAGPGTVDLRGALGKVYRSGFLDWNGEWQPFTTIFAVALDDQRIFRVGGMMFKNLNDAHDTFTELKKGLARKYGPASAEGSKPPPAHFWDEVLETAEWAKFSDGTSEIEIRRGVNDFNLGCRIEIDYVSLNLARQADKEKAKRDHLMHGL
jgi:hypothetical protein